MSDSLQTTESKPKFRAGDWVEVRQIADILATLDGNGCLDALPFMPEMIQYCGKRFQVYKSAHKTCDTIKAFKGRSMNDAVHLEDLRCTGDAHGDCQAGCLLFWKTAWLKRIQPNEAESGTRDTAESEPETDAGKDLAPVPELLANAAVTETVNGQDSSVRYTCQATELVRATSHQPWWTPGQYLKDLTSGNVGLFKLIRYMALATYNATMRLHWRGRPYPYVKGLAGKKTPNEVLDLQPGEMVRVRSRDEIMRTINVHQRNRGLFFDVEMVPFCGKEFRVLKRVERILNEETGEMMHMPNACIILEDVTCSGCYSQHRLFCPRNVYPYWREIWLKRVEN